MKSLLIIGGTGFFGKSILDVFIRGGLDIYGINQIKILSRSVGEFKSRYPALINENVKFFASDISNCKSLPEADIVIHAASSADAREYIINANSQKNNIKAATTNYCRLAVLYHKHSKILYCSSGAVYGRQPPDLEFIPEDFSFQNVNDLVGYKRDYALGKRFSERSICDLGYLGLNVSIARCFSFYGKYLPKDHSFAYGNFLANAEQGKTIEVHAKHRVIRGYMHADHMVYALIDVAMAARPECPIYNVGSGHPIELRELAGIIAKKYRVGVSSPNIDDDFVDRYVPDVTQLRELMLSSVSPNFDENIYFGLL